MAIFITPSQDPDITYDVKYANPGEALQVLEVDPFTLGFPSAQPYPPPYFCRALVNTRGITDLSGAWQGCTSITEFPALELGSCLNFEGAWQGCTSLTVFPEGQFDGCQCSNYANAWIDCNLNQQSVDNILISLDNSGVLSGTVDISGGEAPSSLGESALQSLEGKGWAVTVPGIVRSGLVMNLDAGNPASYPGTGTTWTDLTINGNDGTLMNGVSYNPENQGYLVFDGVNDYVDCGDGLTLDVPDDLTLSLWVKFPVGYGNSNAWNTIIAKRPSNTVANFGMNYHPTADSFQFYYLGASPSILSIPFNSNFPEETWINICGTFSKNGSTTDAKLYLNSVSMAEVNLPGNVPSTTGSTSIGAIGDYQDEFAAISIADVMVYNRALTQPEILQNFAALQARYSSIVTDGLILNLDAGNPVSYPGSGTTWSDLSGNNYDGTLVNGVGYDSADGGSLVFDGVDDYVTLGTPTLLNGAQVPLTITGWANVENTNVNRTLYSAYKFPGNNEIYSIIRLDGPTLKYYASTSGGGYQENGTFTPSLNTWNFYAVVISGTLSSPAVKIFLNQTSETFSYAPFTATPDLTVDFRIGDSQFGFGERWQGKVSNINVYNRALTDQEVTQNYNALKGRYGL